MTGKADTLRKSLRVGALIEDLDMKDINYCNEAFYEYCPDPDALPSYPDCGGLSATAVKALQNTLGNLRAGSENHLCAFISCTGPAIDGCYEAQYLAQKEVWDIIDAKCRSFIDLGYVCEPEGPALSLGGKPGNVGGTASDFACAKFVVTDNSVNAFPRAPAVLHRSTGSCLERQAHPVGHASREKEALPAPPCFL